MDRVHGAPTGPPGPAASAQGEAARGPLLAPETRPVLRITGGPGSGTEMPLLAQHTFIGRARENTLCVADLSMSRRHAVIEKTPDGWYLRDLGSGNGTQLNGARVKSAYLAEGDRIALGDSVITVGSKPPPAGSKPASAPAVDHELPALSAPTSPGARARDAPPPQPRVSTLRMLSPYLVGAGVAALLAVTGAVLLSASDGRGSLREVAEKRVEEGLLLMTRGEWERAREHFQVARKLDPQSEVAARNLDKADLEAECARSVAPADRETAGRRFEEARAILAAVPPRCAGSRSLGAAMARLQESMLRPIPEDP